MPRFHLCEIPLAGVGRRRLLASKFFYSGVHAGARDDVRGSGPFPAFLRHPDCLPGLRFPGGRSENWHWSLGIGPGEVSGKRGSATTSLNLAVWNGVSLLHTFFFKRTFLLISPPLTPPLPPLLHHSPPPHTPIQPSPHFMVSGWAVAGILFQACSLFLVNTERALNWLSLLVPSHFSHHSANLYNILHLTAW